MPKKRLLFVVHSLTLAGTERIVFEMAKTLQEEYQVGICCLDDRGFFWDRLQSEGIKLYCLERKAGWHWKNFYRMNQVLKNFKPDIIHAHQYTPYFYSVMAKIMTFSHTKLIFTEHGRHFPDQVRRTRRMLNQLFLKFTDAVTAVSEFSKSRLYQLEGIRSKPIQVIYNGLVSPAKNEEKRDIRAECGLSADTKIIGFVGNLRPVKNPFFLLRAFQEVAENRSDVALVFIGEGPLKKRLMAMAEEFELQNKVHLIGPRYPAEPYLSSFDIFVLPSLSEGTSLALLEAICHEVPVIVTDRGGSPEIVQDGKTGFVVECNDKEALAEAMAAILEYPEASRQMAQDARHDIVDRFQFSKMMQAYKKIYKEVHA